MVAQPPQQLELGTQLYNMNQINKWTEENLMLLNEKKTKSIIFNFSKKHTFTTDMMLKNQRIEIVSANGLGNLRLR